MELAEATDGRANSDGGSSPNQIKGKNGIEKVRQAGNECKRASGMKVRTARESKLSTGDARGGVGTTSSRLAASRARPDADGSAADGILK